MALRDYLSWASFVVGAGVCLAGSMGDLWPVLDLAALAVWPAVLLASLAGLRLVLVVRSPSARVVIAVVLVGAWLTLRHPASPRAGCAPHAARLRVAWINAHQPQDAAPIARWAARERPQVLGVAELGTPSFALRQTLSRQFAYSGSCLGNGRCSTLLFASVSPSDIAPLARGDAENRKTVSALRMTLPGIESGRDRFDVLAVHLSRPLPLGRQARELARLERAIRASADTIVIGDFNLTPRMHLLRDFAARNGLAIVRTDRPTWPALLGAHRAPGLWQIDHLLLGGNWRLAAIRVSPFLGSDHLGYVADLCRADRD